MKKYIVLILTVALCTSLNAQKDRRERKREYEALKVAYITDRLDFTPEEAQLFWPLQNQFEKDFDGLRQSMRGSENESLSEAEALAFIDKRMKTEQQMLDLKKKYISDLKAVLPAPKIAMLFEIEHEFKTRMIRSIRDKRRDRSN